VHRAGLLHGDVKAHNVMREDSGRIVLMDFGAGCDVSDHDRANVLAGTALYLAPEILDGAPATAGNDIYSLGVMLYHLVTGSYPIRGETLAEIRRAHTNGGAVPLRHERIDLPEALIQAVEAALSPDPEHRIESASEMEAALAVVLQQPVAPVENPAPLTDRPSHASAPIHARRRRTHGFVISGLAVAFATVTTMTQPELRQRLAEVFHPSTRIESIAILPFDNRSGDEYQFLAEGVADEIGRQLSRIRHVRVLSRQSSGGVREIDVGELAQRLRVQALLSGSFQKSTTGLHVTARLVDGRSRKELASYDYAGPLNDIGGGRGPAREIARAFQRQFWSEEDIAGSSERPQSAYLAYLKGRSHLSARTEAPLREAVTRFEQAVAAEPTFAEAYAGLADAHTLTGIFGFATRRDAWPKAKAAATEALRLDDRLAEAHTSLAFGLELWEHRWTEAEASFKRAIALNPSYALAHHWYALLLDSMLRPVEALREIEAAAALEPFSAPISTDVGMILAHQQRYDSAIEQLTRTLAAHPTYADAHKELGWAYGLSGRLDAALASMQRARELGSNDADVLGAIGCIYARARRRPEAIAIMRELEARDATRFGAGTYYPAAILLELGEKEKALDVMLKALPDGDVNILVGRTWDTVRGDPRYKELLRRTGL
jgi:TolB-like protein/Tfp pilus assembly protein PilF